MARNILITGGASGLGRAMTEGLLLDGHRVAIADLSKDSIAETMAANAGAGDRLAAFEVDLSETSECERLVREAEAWMGPVDVIINNAGIGPTSLGPDAHARIRRFWEMPPEVYDRFFAVNSRAPFRLASLVAPGMIERGWGRILNVTTGLDSMLKYMFYGGSKAATEAHTACIASALEGTGVTANVMTPGGWTLTGMTKNSGPHDKMYPPTIMAGPARWLASDASNGVTARRFVGVRWDNDLPPDEAAKIAGPPVAWTGFGVQPNNVEG